MRFRELDVVRGAAVLLMVFFHFIWTANFFGSKIQIPYFSLLQIIIAGTFITISGIVSVISYSKNEDYVIRAIRRAGKIFFAGLLVTLFTLIFFSKMVVWFGILHFLGAVILISPLFLKYKWMNLGLAGVIFLVNYLFELKGFGFEELFWLGFGGSAAALDFFPIIPWIGFFLFGIFLGKQFYEKGKKVLEIENNKFLDLLSVLGKNSLLVYFLHQPFLIVIFVFFF